VYEHPFGINHLTALMSHVHACLIVHVALWQDTYREVEIVGHPDPSLTYTFEDRDPKRDLLFYGTPAGHPLTPEQRARADRHGVGSKAAMYGQLRTPVHWRALLKAWLDLARAHPAAHPRLAGAIGYCLGGQSILEQVRAGHGLQVSIGFIVRVCAMCGCVYEWVRVGVDACVCVCVFQIVWVFEYTGACVCFRVFGCLST
jgi:hypothetical protein